MNKYHCLLISLIFFALNTLAGPMQGNYTIDSGNATSGTNFKSWTDFRQTIVSNGVSGAVYVDVLTDQMATSQIAFSAITGTSSSNRIYINGHGKKLSANVSDAVLLFDGADYIQLDSLWINNSSTNPSAIGIRFRNNSDHNTISHCLIEFSGLVNTATNQGAYIAFADAANTLATAENKPTGSYNTLLFNIMQCTVKNSSGPTFGIVLKGNSSTYANTAQNNTASGNLILNFAYIGIYMLNTNGNHLILNDISRMGADTSNCSSIIYGIYSKDAASTDRSNKIDSNQIHDLPKDSISNGGNITTLYGICTMNVKGTDSFRFTIAGNLIRNLYSTQNSYIMYNTYNYFMDVINNMADNLDLPVSGSSAINFYGIYNGYISGSYRINNNTIKNCEGGYFWYGIQNFYPQAATGVQQINDNSIINNLHAYFYRYNIYSYYADKSNSSHQIEIARNLISGNVTDNYYSYNIYCKNYGDYLITDNIIEKNISNHIYMYGLNLSYYGTYHVERNIIRGNIAKLNTIQGYFYGIYSDQNHSQSYLSNLIVENSGNAGTYGMFISSNISGNFAHEFRQNTVVSNGLSSGNSAHSAYPIYCNVPYSTGFKFIGNLVDVTNSNGLYLYLYTNNSLVVDYNSYHVSNVNTESYTTSDSGCANLNCWVNSNLGTHELIATTGHHFDTVTYASRWYWNQDNVPSVSYNLSDVYGVTRNSSYSDRGAVEYSGQTSVDFITKSEIECTVYPNPGNGEMINIFNPGLQQNATLFDITGKIIDTFMVEPDLNTIQTGLDKGVYFIRFSGSGQTVRLIIQ